MENERKEQQSRFVKVRKVMEICDCSESHAYTAAKTIDRLQEMCGGIEMSWKSWRIR